MKNALLPLLLCSALSNTSLAAEPVNNHTNLHKGAYAGLAFGTSDYDDGELFKQLRVNESHGLTRLYGGYQFNRYLMVEAALTSLGEHEAKNTQVDIDTRFSALMFSVIAQYPSDFGLAVYGQLGLGLVSVYQEYHYINLNANLIEGDDDESDGAWLTGAGLSYSAPQLKKLRFRLGWERYYHDTDIITAKNGYIFRDSQQQKMDVYYLGASYRF